MSAESAPKAGVGLDRGSRFRMAAEVPGWRQPHRFTVKAAATLTAALLAAGLATIPASAATTTASVRTAPGRTAAGSASRPAALASLETRAMSVARSAAADRSGVIYGTVVGYRLRGRVVAACNVGSRSESHQRGR
jgi:hypothetical protein